jgi:hypothetical protein
MAEMTLPTMMPSAPKPPKKCSGRLMYLSRKRMVSRSKKTRKVRPMP